MNRVFLRKLRHDLHHQPFVDREMEEAAHARRACTSGMLLRLHRWRHITTASRCELDVLLLTTIHAS
jgi:hypothetical protein